MLTVEFMQKLEERYPSMTRELGRDITNLINPLDRNQRQQLWDVFIDSYEFNTPPRRAVLVKLMMKEGIYKKRGDTHVYYCYCKDCGIGYPTDVKCCQLCGKEFHGVVQSDRLPDNFMRMHQECETCARFEPYETYGSFCQLWGIQQTEWHLEGPAYKEQIERCKKCPCKICCRAERIYRTNYDLYKEMTARGDFKDGYMPRAKNH